MQPPVRPRPPSWRASYRPLSPRVCAWIERGQTVKALALDLSKSLKPIEITYDGLMRYLRDKFTTEAVESSMDTARVRASHSMAEDALRIVDAKAESQQDVSRAASRARARQWMAERYNPQRFGSQKGVNVALSITSLHLSALQAGPQVVTSSLQPAANSLQVGSGQPIQVVEP